MATGGEKIFKKVNWEVAYIPNKQLCQVKKEKKKEKKRDKKIKQADDPDTSPKKTGRWHRSSASGNCKLQR